MIAIVKRWLRKRKAFKAYRGKLRKHLREIHGKSINLNYNDLNKALKQLKLEGEFECYAYAMSLSKSQYKHYQKLNGVIWSQDALQIELGVSKELLNTQHFPSGGYGP